MDLLELESYADTFGKKARRKRVKLNAETLEEVAQEAQLKENKYEASNDTKLNPVEQT